METNADEDIKKEETDKKPTRKRTRSDSSDEANRPSRSRARGSNRPSRSRSRSNRPSRSRAREPKAEREIENVVTAAKKEIEKARSPFAKYKKALWMYKGDTFHAGTSSSSSTAAAQDISTHERDAKRSRMDINNSSSNGLFSGEAESGGGAANKSVDQLVEDYIEYFRRNVEGSNSTRMYGGGHKYRGGDRETVLSNPLVRNDNASRYYDRDIERDMEAGNTKKVDAKSEQQQILERYLVNRNSSTSGVGGGDLTSNADVFKFGR